MTLTAAFDADTAFVARDTPSLADLITEAGTARLSPVALRDRRSALRRVAAALGRAPEDIPADPAWLRKRLARIEPVALGITPKTWANLLSNLRAALGTRTTRRPELDPEWQALRDLLAGEERRGLRIALGSFIRFASIHGIAPADVDDTTVALFHQGLVATEIRREPETAVYVATSNWNRACDRVEGWPPQRLDVPDRTNHFALPWTIFPEALRTQTEAWLTRNPSTDIFDLSAPDKPLAEATVLHRRGQVRRFASALVHDGVDAADLAGLKELVHSEHITRGLRWLVTRNDGKPSGAIANMAQMLLTMARYLEADDAIDVLKPLTKRLTIPHAGMTEKNRDRLRPFQDAQEVAKILHLPERLLRTSVAMKNPHHAACQVETALMIALLTHCPIRIRNLVGIHLDRHLVTVGRCKAARQYLVIPGTETKTGTRLEFELPAELGALIKCFVEDHRPALLEHPGRWLFSQRAQDHPMDRSTAGGRIGRTIRKETGHPFNPHLFRHFAARLSLQAQPGNYEVVRRLLGHSETSNTIDCYADIETDAAARAFSGLLETLRTEVRI